MCNKKKKKGGTMERLRGPEALPSLSLGAWDGY